MTAVSARPPRPGPATGSPPARPVGVGPHSGLAADAPMPRRRGTLPRRHRLGTRWPARDGESSGGSGRGIAGRRPARCSFTLSTAPTAPLSHSCSFRRLSPALPAPSAQCQLRCQPQRLCLTGDFHFGFSCGSHIGFGSGSGPFLRRKTWPAEQAWVPRRIQRTAKRLSYIQQQCSGKRRSTRFSSNTEKGCRQGRPESRERVPRKSTDLVR